MDLNFLRINYPVKFEDIAFPSSLKVWVCAAHAGDFEAVAVTAKKFQQMGAELTVTVLAPGIFNESENEEQLKSLISTTQSHQLESCEKFGIEAQSVFFPEMDLTKNGQIADSDKNYELLKKHFDEVAPDVMILPHGDDTDVDHRLIWIYAKELAATRSKPLIMMAAREHTTQKTRDDIHTEFGEESAAWKSDLLAIHQLRQGSAAKQQFHKFVIEQNAVHAKNKESENNFIEAFELKVFA